MTDLDEPRTLATGSSGAKKQRFAVTTRDQLQLHVGRNLFQAVSVITVMLVGALVGWLFAPAEAGLCALLGGAAGMILGAFLSGFVLMFFPPTFTTTFTTAAQLQRKHQLLMRQLRATQIIGVSSILILPLILKKFGDDDSNLAWCVVLGWFVLTFGCVIYSKVVAAALNNLKCPACGKSFKRIAFPCRGCGLSVESDENFAP